MKSIKNTYRALLPVSFRQSIFKLKQPIKKKLIDCLDYCFAFEQYPYKKYHDEHKCIFIHIPKNAGTSVIQLLAGNTSATSRRIHERYRTYLEVDSVKFAEYEKFCIVRNPWDRVLSAYLYLINGGNKSCDLTFSSILKKEAPTFEVFVKEWLDLNKIYNITVLQPQLFYIYDFQNQKIMVDTILRMENLEIDFQKFKDKIGITERLPMINQTQHKNYVEYYDTEMIEKVYNFYKDDIELLKYKFDDR